MFSLRKTKGKKNPAFALNGGVTWKNRSEEETDGPILYEKAEREDVTWESPQNKPSVRCKACVTAGIAGSQNTQAAKDAVLGMKQNCISLLSSLYSRRRGPR